MAGFWDDYLARKRKQEEEEEERKRTVEAETAEDGEGDSLSFWAGYQRKKRTGESVPVPAEKEESLSLTDRLAQRGIAVDPVARHGTNAQGQTAAPADTSRTLAALSENGKTSTNLFTDRLGSTFTAARAQRDKLAAQAEEERKNQTVRNQEWLDALRSPEEIQAELDEENAKVKEYDRQAFKNNALGVWRDLIGQNAKTDEENQRISAERKAHDERKAALEDELAEAQWASYERLRNNSDFEVKSQYKSTANGQETKKNPNGGYDSVGFDDVEYEYVNGNQDAATILANESREAGEANGILGVFVKPKEYEYTQLGEMSDEEKSLYNYIHATQGKQAAHEYLEYLRSDLYARQADKEKNEAAAYAEEHPVLSTVRTVGTSPLRGVGYLGQAAQYLTEGTVDANAPYNRFSYLTSAERETVTRTVERNWGKAGSFAYGVGVSMAEFLLNSGISGGNEALSLALMGAGAASDATIEAKERGLADWQSFALGTIAGAAEIITERVSIEKLFSDPGGRPWKYLLQNILAEGSEEAASDVINLVADVLITQDKSEWMQSVRDYQKNNPGMSEDEAFVQVMKDQGLQILYDAAAGAASGGIMALPGSLRAFAQLSQDRSQRIEAGRQAIQAKRSQTQENGGGIVLPTADNTSETGDVIRTGAESDSTNPLRTVDEAEVDERVAKARNITEATGIRYGVDQKEIRRAERLGRMTGQEVEFYSHEAENGIVENGHMDPVTGKIWLNAKGKNPLQVTLGHEFTHSLEGTDAYQELVDLAKTQTAESGGDWAAKADRYARLYEAHGDRVSDEMLDQELTADFVGETLFTDERAIREMFRENPSLGKQVRDAIDNFIVRASDMGGIMSPVDEQKFKNVLKIYDRYVRAADREKTAQEGRGGAQAGESVQAGSRQGEVQNVQETAVVQTAEGSETPDQLRARADALFDAGEIDEAQYDDMIALAEEAESTGRGFESSTVEREEGPRSKVGELIDRVRGRYSLSEDADYMAAYTKNGDLQLSDANAPRLYVQNESAESPSSIIAETDGDVNRGEDSTSIISRPLSEYPIEKQKQIQQYIDAVDDSVLNFVNETRQKKKRYPFSIVTGIVSDELASRIRDITGVDMTGKEVRLRRNSIEHVDNRHTSKKADVKNIADQMMEDPRDIARAQYVLDNFDNVEKGKWRSRDIMNSDNTGAQTVVVSKKIDGTYYVIEAVPDAKDKRLEIVSAHIKGDGSVADANAPSPTSITTVPQSPESSISDSGTEVNGGEERFSLSEEAERADADYMAAVEAGDEETAQRMVDEAAERAGYTRRMWHGAKSGKTFTQFRGWSYFTEDRAFAEKYTNRDPENLYGVYAKVEHPFDTRTDREARRIFEEARRENGFTQLGDSGLPDWTDGYDLADYIDENELDYDGILLDEGEQYVPNERGELESRGRVESYVIRDSAQVKSADPVTYDDDGNVIPLSQRFNPEEDDIRYSVSEADEETRRRRYDYDTLVNKKNVRIVPMKVEQIPTSGKKLDLPAMATAGRRNASVIAKDGYKQRYVYIPDIGENVLITTTGVKHGITGNKTNTSTMDTAQVTYYLPEILRSSVAVNEIDPRSEKDGDYSLILFGYAEDDLGKGYLVKSTLNHFGKNRSVIDDVEVYNVLKGIRGKKIDAEVIGDLSNQGDGLTRNSSASDMSVSHLLDIVKRIHPEFLSEDVRNHLGVADTRREEGLRYSLSAEEIDRLDEDYMDAAMRGDRDAEDRIMLRRAIEGGYDIEGYHGTEADFDEFKYGDIGYHIGTEAQARARIKDKRFFERREGSPQRNARIMHLRANLQNPLEVDYDFGDWHGPTVVRELLDNEVFKDDEIYNGHTGAEINQALEDALTNMNANWWENDPEDDRAVRELLMRFGYDGIAYPNEAEAVTPEMRATGDYPTSYIVFNPEQLKYADAETYDYAGNLILPSERYDSRSPNMRWSLSEEQGPIANLPSAKARTNAIQIEGRLAASMARIFGLNDNRTTPEFRQFRAEVVRPIIDAMIEGREDIDPDAIFAEHWNGDLLAGQEARDQFDEAVTRAWQSVQQLNTFANRQRQEAAAREQRNAAIDARIPADTEGRIRLGENLKQARRERQRVLNRLLLTDEDMALVRAVAAGQMTDEQVYAQRPFNYQDILEAAAAERAFREQDEAWGRYTRRLSERRIETADRLSKNADQWKDKGNGFAYARETAERNFRDVMGSDAAAMIDEYIRPIHIAEAESTRFKNRYIKRVKDLKLDQKARRGNAVSEAAAVQWLGEAEDNVRYLQTMRNPDAVRDGQNLSEWLSAIEQFRAENPNLDYNKVYLGIREFSKIYHELITEMNRVLVENGHLPVNVRRGYFPHFNGGDDGILSKFASLLGINIDTNALPTAINGLTSGFKPGKAWFGHAQERTGFRTDYDAVQGFDGYIGGVSDVIHQTANIRNLRTLDSRIRYQFSDEGIKNRIDEIMADESRTVEEREAAIRDLTENGRFKNARLVNWLDEYTNLLANKKSKYDRGIEDLMGRRVYTWMKNIEGRVAANMIAGNLGSALTNFIPLNQAGAMLGDFSMLRGAFDTMVGRGRKDDFVQQSDFLTNRRGTDPLIQNRADRISEFLSSPMNLIDNFTSEAIVRAAYGKYLRSGMDAESAMQAADEFAAGVMADRSKGAQPTVFGSRNPLMKLFTQFQVEVNNEFSTIFKDIPKGVHIPDREKKNMAAVAAWTLLRYFVGAYLFNDLYEKIVGRRAALDPIDILNDAVGDLSGKKLNNVFDMISEGVIDDVRRQNPSDVTQELVKNVAEELPFVGGLLGGGRIPISSAFPDFENINKAAFSENWSGAKKAQVIGRELGGSIGTYILPPFAGGAIKKGVQTAANTLAGGRYVKDKEGNDQLQYPFYMDTPLDAAGTIAKSALFGPTATEGGRDWVEGGFGNQSAKNTALYRELTGDLGESQRNSWDFIRSLAQQDAQGKRMAVAESGLSDEGKALAMERIMNSGQSTEGTKFRAAYDNGVSADVWAALYGGMSKYDLNGNNKYTQPEIREALDNMTVPLSSGEGAAQGLFGGSTEERHLTNSEKAALWSAYDPTWATKNNPYSPQIGERVVSRYNELKGAGE